jgi:hypothetical protein
MYMMMTQMPTSQRETESVTEHLTELLQLGSYTLSTAAQGFTRVGKERTGFVLYQPRW